MVIAKVLKTHRTLSFEFFPAKTREGRGKLERVISKLSKCNPDFISMTYGAGGSTREGTLDVSVRTQAATGLRVMAHVTGSGQSREEVHGYLSQLEAGGIKDVMALRGDRIIHDGSTTGQCEEGFVHANDLIRYIKRNFTFGIGAACYPEGHPESASLAEDLEFVKKKVGEGAEFLISQLFFENSTFLNMLNGARKTINVPIVAGIMPIHSLSQITRITQMSGTKPPKQLSDLLEKYGGDSEAVRNIGVEFAIKQVKDLWKNGVDGIHFYVLNRTHSVVSILEGLDIPIADERVSLYGR